LSAAGRLALAVALAWLMPMRAARKIRRQEHAMLWLVDRTLFVYRQNEDLRAKLGMPAMGAHLRSVK
jgi:hypothetical protein